MSRMVQDEPVRVNQRFVTQPGTDSKGQTHEVFCVRFSPNDEYIAASYSNGAIRVFRTQDKENKAKGSMEHLLNDGNSRFPTTQVRWRPEGGSSTTKTKNVLVSVNAEGDGNINFLLIFVFLLLNFLLKINLKKKNQKNNQTTGGVQHHHVKSGKTLHEIKHTNNPLFCVDYSPDATLFAVAGRERAIYVYDEATKRPYVTLQGGDSLTTAGHSNRVFSLKIKDEHTILTGGWDNTVQIWDMRKKHAVQSIFGVYICGDGLDISKDGTKL